MAFILCLCRTIHSFDSEIIQLNTANSSTGRIWVVWSRSAGKGQGQALNGRTKEWWLPPPPRTTKALGEWVGPPPPPPQTTKPWGECPDPYPAAPPLGGVYFRTATAPAHFRSVGTIQTDNHRMDIAGCNLYNKWWVPMHMLRICLKPGRRLSNNMFGKC